LNEFSADNLKERLTAAQQTVIHPLLMCATSTNRRVQESHAINEVSVFRQSYQAARLRILVDGKERLSDLTADGVLVATPAGSTAYNLSAQGPIIPIDASLLAVTPISPFRPRRWRGALLPDKAKVTIEVLDADKRPAAAVADHDEVRDVQKVEVSMDRRISLHLLFDPHHSLDERILREQFGY
jgi:NAD+ kinase